MIRKEEIRNILLEKTEFLNELGYIDRVENSDDWNYTLSYLARDKGVAIEFEIDYRDFDVFVLITILEAGKLPDGYYMNRGNRGRVHIEQLHEDGKVCSGDWNTMSAIRKELKVPNEYKLISLITAYSKLLQEAANDIQKLNSKLIQSGQLMIKRIKTIDDAWIN